MTRWWGSIDGAAAPSRPIGDEEVPVSEMSQGPGWWIASDGKWYPPQSHPDVLRTPEPTTVAPATSPPSPAAPPSTADVAPSGASSVPAPVPTVRRRRSKVPWILGVAFLLALAVAALVVALTSSGGSGLTPGAQTATITIRDPHTGRPSFSGTLGGNTLTGTVTGTGTTGVGAGAASPGAPLFTYQGSLGGTPYVLHVSLEDRSGGSDVLGSVIAFQITGTYGSEPVTGNAEFDLRSSGAGRSLTVPISGRVGSQVISGTATAVVDGNGTIDVKAQLDVLAPL